MRRFPSQDFCAKWVFRLISYAQWSPIFTKSCRNYWNHAETIGIMQKQLVSCKRFGTYCGDLVISLWTHADVIGAHQINAFGFIIQENALFLNHTQVICEWLVLNCLRPTWWCSDDEDPNLFEADDVFGNVCHEVFLGKISQCCVDNVVHICWSEVAEWAEWWWTWLEKESTITTI